MPKPHVAVAGGGASGLLLARELVESGCAVTIIEPRERLGAGVAYSTACPLHLLNVPAGNISAVQNDPEHFVRWLSNAGETADAAAFVPRAIYGRYLDTIAEGLRRDGHATFAHLQLRALDCTVAPDGVRVTCSDGAELAADTLVVAVGNAEPAPWPLDTHLLAAPVYFRSAWSEGAIVPGDPDETVVLLGTGLTAIDATLGLRYHGHRGPIVMISRRGLLPHEHRLFDTPPVSAPEAETVRDLIVALRGAARADRSERGWRGAIDGLRPHTNARWRALSLDEQRRMLRHALPYWNVHRHRVAPEAAKTIAELIAADVLRMLAGRTEHLTVQGRTIDVDVRLRGGNERTSIRADRVINCSGPQNDFTKLRNPLIRALIDRGSISPHQLGIGARVSVDGAFIDARGIPSTRLYAIGPVRFGTLIETTAIPEIRAQAHELAQNLAAVREFDFQAR